MMNARHINVSLPRHPGLNGPRRCAMKLLFSEHKSDYGHYVFPYAIWAFPEARETPADLFGHGFLPSSRDLDRFYLCRQVRVHLRDYRPSSENRRVLRKCGGITVKLVPRAEFDYTPARRSFCKAYADVRFGHDVMTEARLDALFGAPITSHVLVFTDSANGAEAGVATLFLEPRAMAYYYYAFYNLAYYERNLGMYMMTSAAGFFAERGFDFLYLGTCYRPNALYKTQFSGAQFFNGNCWSPNLDELKYLIRRDQEHPHQHLLETEEYCRLFHDGSVAPLVEASAFTVK